MDKDTEFLAAAEAEMDALETWLEEASDELDCSRSGNVLTVELDDGDQVVINIQTPMHEIWCASRFGGFHFSLRDGRWRDSRSAGTLEAAVAEALARLGVRVNAVP